METVARNAGRGAGPAQAAPGRRPDRPRPGAGGDRRGARAGPARRCASSATTSRRSRAPTWWPAWSSSRTGWPARASTAGSSSRGATDDLSAISEVLRRRFARYLDAAQIAERPATGAGIDPDDRPAAQVRLPAATGRGRRRRSRRSTPPRRCSPSLGITDVAVCGLAKRLEEVWLPGEAVPGDPAAHLRGALPAAAGARRGAPVRHHLPPAAALQADDRLRVGRRARAGRDPAQGVAAPFGSLKRLGRGERRTRSPRCPGIGRRTAEAVAALNPDRRPTGCRWRRCRGVGLPRSTGRSTPVAADPDAGLGRADVAGRHVTDPVGRGSGVTERPRRPTGGGGRPVVAEWRDGGDGRREPRPTW